MANFERIEHSRRNMKNREFLPKSKEIHVILTFWREFAAAFREKGVWRIGEKPRKDHEMHY